MRIDVPHGPDPRTRTSLAEDTERLLESEEENQSDTGEANRDNTALETESFETKRFGPQSSGWNPLLWSFGAAASITVSIASFPML